MWTIQGEGSEESSPRRGAILAEGTISPEHLSRLIQCIEAPLGLDVATGRGGFASYLRESVPGLGMLVGIDLSFDVVVKSREPLDSIPDLAVCCMDSAGMAFSSGTFQLVSISNSLHHMSDLEAALHEMIRVLQPGGWLIVQEMYRDGQTPSQMSHVMMHEWWAEIDRASGTPHFDTYSRNEILRIVSSLELEDTVCSDSPPPHTDPFNEENLQRGYAAIDAYIKRSSDRRDSEGLSARGEELRRYLGENGLHMASAMTILGRKPQ